MIPVSSQLDVILARWVMGIAGPIELVREGVSLLESGADTPSLRQLAGCDSCATSDVHELFRRTVKELGSCEPSPEQAGFILARSIASDIIQGQIPPYEGARRIWTEIVARVPTLQSDLDVFVALASEYEDQPSLRMEYERDIVDEARRLLQ